MLTAPYGEVIVVVVIPSIVSAAEHERVIAFVAVAPPSSFTTNVWPSVAAEANGIVRVRGLEVVSTPK